MPHFPGFATRLREAARPYYLRHVFFRLFPERRPAEFLRCWEPPHEFQGSAPALEIPPPVPSLCDVLFLPMTDWHHRLQRTQRLALALAALGHRCFLLNPHLGREYPSAPWPGRRPALARLDERVFEIHAPLPSEPVFHHRLLAPVESMAVAEALDWALRRAGVQRLALMLSLPTWLGAALLLQQRWQAPLVYDCHDWLPSLPGMAPSIAAAEPDAMRRSDLVLFCSRGLLTHLGGALPEIGERTALVENGVPDWPPPSSPRTSQPVAGYIGAMERWFWVDAVVESARLLPDVRFTLFGAPHPRIRSAFYGLPNVVLPGEAPASQVPALLAGFRVGLLPRIGDQARFMAPIKIYEYFHYGLPVVAGPMPELDRFGPLVYRADTPAAFARAVAEALREDDPALESARRQHARQAFWRNRAESLSRLLAETAQRRRRASA
jgi:glycosyltransferase involved in cell wall biosynthesis